MKLEHYLFKAMGCPCELHLYDEPRARAADVAKAAIAEVERLERKYSRYRDDSVIAEINRSAGDAAGTVVDPETAALLDYAEIGFRQSRGLFDITSGILRRAWDFKSGRIPSQAELDRLRARIGWQKVQWRAPKLVLPVKGMELDFGGFVKEYAADRVAELCREWGTRSGLIDLGGDLCVVGPHYPEGPGGPKQPWRVGIRDPRQSSRALATVDLGWGGIASSGDYERCILVDGKRYGHILNPKTGWPVQGLTSVSVVASHCLIAGTASTVAMLKDEDAAGTWLRELGLPHLSLDSHERLTGSLLA